jgi:hypothetical protein
LQCDSKTQTRPGKVQKALASNKGTVGLVVDELEEDSFASALRPIQASLLVFENVSIYWKYD